MGQGADSVGEEYHFHVFRDNGTGWCVRCDAREDGIEHVEGPERTRLVRPPGSHYRGGDRPQPGRWRCLMVGCNPVLNETSAVTHSSDTGHRVAKWPVRSAEGKKKARARNKNGYYDRYNVGYKSAESRLR